MQAHIKDHTTIASCRAILKFWGPTFPVINIAAKPSYAYRRISQTSIQLLRGQCTQRPATVAESIRSVLSIAIAEISLSNQIVRRPLVNQAANKNHAVSAAGPKTSETSESSPRHGLALINRRWFSMKWCCRISSYQISQTDSDAKFEVALTEDCCRCNNRRFNRLPWQSGLKQCTHCCRGRRSFERVPFHWVTGLEAGRTRFNHTHLNK